MRIQAESESVLQERKRVDRSLRMLRGKLEVLERTRKDADERNQVAHRTNVVMSHEYAASLKVKEYQHHVIMSWDITTKVQSENDWVIRIIILVYFLASK